MMMLAVGMNRKPPHKTGVYVLFSVILVRNITTVYWHLNEKTL